MIIFFLLGIVMALLGTSLLVMGRGRIGSREINQTWARRLGIFFVAFFPVILIERVVLQRLDPEEEIDPMMVHACLTGVWVLLSLYLVTRAVGKPKRPTPRRLQVPEAELPGVSTRPRAQSRRRSSREASESPSNPFDFD